MYPCYIWLSEYALSTVCLKNFRCCRWVQQHFSTQVWLKRVGKRNRLSQTRQTLKCSKMWISAHNARAWGSSEQKREILWDDEKMQRRMLKRISWRHDKRSHPFWSLVLTAEQIASLFRIELYLEFSIIFNKNRSKIGHSGWVLFFPSVRLFGSVFFVQVLVS